jgi:hypothetical protein
VRDGVDAVRVAFSGGGGAFGGYGYSTGMSKLRAIFFVASHALQTTLTAAAPTIFIADPPHNPAQLMEEDPDRFGDEDEDEEDEGEEEEEQEAGAGAQNGR